jgi:hypothetical protein
MTTLKRIHFYFGLGVILHFVITGLLMRLNYFSIEPQDTLVRMMLRANHIYILFSGLVHLLISYSLRESNTRKLHLVASSILILATLGINVSFYIDPINHLNLSTHFIQRKLTGFSVQGFILGTGIYLLLLQFKIKKNNEPTDRSPNR